MAGREGVGIGAGNTCRGLKYLLSEEWGVVESTLPGKGHVVGVGFPVEGGKIFLQIRDLPRQEIIQVSGGFPK
jgi:hypothetical protein